MGGGVEGYKPRKMNTLQFVALPAKLQADDSRGTLAVVQYENT